MSRKVSLKVPEAEGKYWYLYWIDQISYFEKRRKVSIVFINKMTDKNYLYDLNLNSIFKTKINAANLSELYIGLMYDVENKMFLKTSNSIPIKINIKSALYSSNKPFPISDKLFSNQSEIKISDGLNYYKYYAIKREKTGEIGYNVLVTPYVLMQYFFFNNSKLVLMALKDELLDCFQLSTLKFYNDKNTNERIVELKYDKKLGKKEAEIFAPLIFLKNKVGLNFIRSIYSGIHTAYINSKDKNNSASSYLKLDWKFENFSMDVYGQPFKDEKNYFLAHKISQFHFKEQNPFIVDKILLVPFNAKNSTKDRENHEPIDVIRPNSKPNETLLLHLNQGTSNSHDIIQTPSGVIHENPYNVKVEHVNREEQLNAYNVISVGSDPIIDGIIRDVENFDGDMNNIRENIVDEVLRLKSISNLAYFNKVLDSLLLIPNNNLIIDRNLFNEGNENFYEIETNYLKIAEIFSNNCYTYLVEFGYGIIGVFADFYLNKIDSQVLFDISKKFFTYKTSIEKENKQLWTFICKNKKDFLKGDNKINIITGVKHTRKLETSKKENNGKVKVTDDELYKPEVYMDTASRLFKKIKKKS